MKQRIIIEIMGGTVAAVHVSNPGWFEDVQILDWDRLQDMDEPEDQAEFNRLRLQIRPPAFTMVY